MSRPSSPEVAALEELSRHGDVHVTVRRRGPDKGHPTWIIALDAIAVGQLKSEPRLGAKAALADVIEALRSAKEIQ